MQAVRSTAWWRERKENQRKISEALLLSLLLHLVFILCIAWLYRDPYLRIALKKEDAVTLDWVSLPSFYKEFHPDHTTTAPSQSTPLESDRNTQAASSLPARGKAPLPTLNGKESQILQMEDRNYTPGKPAGSALSSAHPPSQQPKKLLSSSQSVPRAQLPILKPFAQDTDLEQKDQTSYPQKTNVSSSFHPPSQAAEPLHHPSESRVIRIDGNISNRGRAALDVATTPLGNYKRLLANAVGARWYYLVHRDIDLYRIGTVSIRFKIHRNGSVDAVQILSNTSNELLAATSIQSIQDAEMPPIPSDIANSLEQGRIEVDYTFSIISN